MDFEEGCITALVALLGAVLVIAFVVQGTIWLFVHEWPYILAAAVIGVSVLVSRFNAKHKARAEQIASVTRESKKIQTVETQAAKATSQLIEQRRKLENNTVKLEELRQTVRGDINFQLLAQKHHESRLYADTWYTQKRQVIATHKEFSTQVNAFKSHIGSLTRARNRVKKGADRSPLGQAIGSAQTTLSHLSAAIATLKGEIDRSGTALDTYNDQTRELKLHIRDTCGPRGRRWYNELEERTRQRKG